mgnify:CR=1 FL=1
MKISRSLFRGYYDVPLAKMSIILSIGLSALLLMNPTRVILLLAAPLVFIICSLWLITRKKASIEMDQSSNYWFKVCVILFFLLFTILIITHHARDSQYVRSPYVFFLISLLSAVLAAEIMISKRANVPFVLFQLASLAIFTVWSQIGLFPYPTGIDPIFHEKVVNDLISTSHVPMYSQYVDSPFFHIIVSSPMLIANIDYVPSVFFSISVIQVVSLLLLTQILASRIGLNHVIGLLSGLALILSPLVIQANVSAIPFSMAIVFMMLLFFLILNQKLTLPRFLLVFVLFIALNLTHPMASAFTGLALLSFMVLEIIYNHLMGLKNCWRPSMLLPVVFVTVMIIGWIFFSGYYDILSNIIQNLINIDPSRAQAQFIQVQMNNIPMGEQIHNYFSFFLLISISFYGVLYSISDKGSRNQFVYSLTAIIPLAIGLVLMATGLNLLNERWLYIAQVLLAIPLAIALVCWSNMIRRQIPRVIVTTVLVFILTFGSITSTFANVDNTSFTPNMNMRYALMASEISAGDFLKATSGDLAYTDTYYSATLYNSGHLTKDFSSLLEAGNFSSCDIVLVRDHVITNVFDAFGAPVRLSYDLNNRVMHDDFSRIYCSNSVYGYTK